MNLNPYQKNQRGSLKISNPFIRHMDNQYGKRVAVVATVVDSSDLREKELYFEYDEDYGDYLVDENADAFVSMLIYYAMMKNLDIVSEAPISERLYYQFTTYFIPVMAQTTKFFHWIKIIAPIYTPSIGSSPAKGVACGFSGGVDSLYTIKKHMEHELVDYRLTHLLFSDLPAQLIDPENNTREKAELYTQENMSFLKKIADELGLPVIICRTNVHFDFDTEIIVDKQHGLVMQAGFHGMKWAACVYAVQKLVGKYYYSSGCSLDQFTMHPYIYDTAYYDTFNVLMLNTESLTFYSTGSEVTRIKKEEALIDYGPAQRHLQVCGPLVDKNCSKCKKCIRTQMGFFAFGKLDNFKDVFDVEDFMSHLSLRMARVLGHPEDDFCREIIQELKHNHVKIPITSYGWAVIIRILEVMRKNLLKYRKNPVLRKIIRVTKIDVLLRGHESTEKA